jgi:hypothetical protein
MAVKVSRRGHLRMPENVHHHAHRRALSKQERRVVPLVVEPLLRQVGLGQRRLKALRDVARLRRFTTRRFSEHGSIQL